jgi:hypothetical protein
MIVLISDFCGSKGMSSLDAEGNDDSVSKQDTAKPEIENSADTGEDSQEEEVCVPQCGEKLCGENGCGGLCGLCTDNLVCENGKCVPPVSDCTDKPCSKGYYCDLISKQCVKGCITDEHCPEYQTCNTSKQECECQKGYHFCEEVCMDSASVDHCGNSCTPCEPPKNSKPVCNGFSCTYKCDKGYNDCKNNCYSKDEYCKGACGSVYGNSCSLSGDCCEGYYCIGSKCLKKTGDSCSKKEECASGMQCESNKCCVPFENSGCETDSQCCAGNICVKGKCFLPPQSKCTKDEECGGIGNQLYCLEEKCCIQDYSEYPCSADADCCGKSDQCLPSKKCEACGIHGELCKEDNDCCGYDVKKGACESGKCCYKYNYNCTTSADCCKGYYCDYDYGFKVCLKQYY